MIGASSFVGKHFIGKFSGEEIIATYNNNKLKNAIRFILLAEELFEFLLKERSKCLKSDINIKTCKFNSFNLGEEWPVDVSMDVSKLMDSSNMVFMTPELACEKIVKTYFKERV